MAITLPTYPICFHSSSFPKVSMTHFTDSAVEITSSDYLFPWIRSIAFEVQTQKKLQTTKAIQNDTLNISLNSPSLLMNELLRLPVYLEGKLRVTAFTHFATFNMTILWFLFSPQKKEKLYLPSCFYISLVSLSVFQSYYYSYFHQMHHPNVLH